MEGSPLSFALWFVPTEEYLSPAFIAYLHGNIKHTERLLRLVTRGGLLGLKDLPTSCGSKGPPTPRSRLNFVGGRAFKIFTVTQALQIDLFFHLLS